MQAVHHDVAEFLEPINSTERDEALQEAIDEHVNLIKFKPHLQKYGLNTYHLYIRVIDQEEIDFKLLLLNTFTSMKFSMDASSFLIKYLFPNGNPNTSYLNWLLFSKKNVSEYCLFTVKKIHRILQFDNNASPEGIRVDKNKFSLHVRNVLSETFHETHRPHIISYDPQAEVIPPDSPSFKSLLEFCSGKSFGIKPFEVQKHVAKMKKIRQLISKGVLSPYLTTKNVGSIETISILVPNIKKELINDIIKICSFFNDVKVCEIQGEFFLYGFPNKISFEHGIFSKRRPEYFSISAVKESEEFFKP